MAKVLLVLFVILATSCCMTKQKVVVSSVSEPVRLKRGASYTAPVDGYFVTDKFLTDLFKTFLAAEATIDQLQEQLNKQPKADSRVGRIDLHSPIGFPARGEQ